MCVLVFLLIVAHVRSHFFFIARYGPHFEDVQRVGQPTNLTVQAGSSIHLNCRISLLQDKTVSIHTQVLIGCTHNTHLTGKCERERYNKLKMHQKNLTICQRGEKKKTNYRVYTDLFPALTKYIEIN